MWPPKDDADNDGNCDDAKSNPLNNSRDVGCGEGSDRVDLPDCTPEGASQWHVRRVWALFAIACCTTTVIMVRDEPVPTKVTSQMSIPSGSIRPRRPSLTWAMVVIAVIAADLAAVRPILPLGLSPTTLDALRASLPPDFPNLGLGVMILVLEVGLFRLVSRRGVGRAFWLGFEVAGWAYVIVMVFAGTAWSLARSLFEEYVLGSQIRFPFGLGRFVLFACGLHLVISLAIACFVGILARSAWRRWGPLSCGPVLSGGPLLP